MIGTQNGFVARFADGRVFKGFTQDLAPGRAAFHLRLADSGARQRIVLDDLKAVFCVKSFDGDSERQDSHEGDRPGYGKKLRVVFEDGEEIVGYTSGYAAEKPAFYLFPVDPESNNNRILVVNRSVKEIEFL